MWRRAATTLAERGRIPVAVLLIAAIGVVFWCGHLPAPRSVAPPALGDDRTGPLTPAPPATPPDVATVFDLAQAWLASQRAALELGTAWLSLVDVNTHWRAAVLAEKQPAQEQQEQVDAAREDSRRCKHIQEEAARTEARARETWKRTSQAATPSLRAYWARLLSRGTGHNPESSGGPEDGCADVEQTVATTNARVAAYQKAAQGLGEAREALSHTVMAAARSGDPGGLADIHDAERRLEQVRTELMQRGQALDAELRVAWEGATERTRLRLTHAESAFAVLRALPATRADAVATSRQALSECRWDAATEAAQLVAALSPGDSEADQLAAAARSGKRESLFVGLAEQARAALRDARWQTAQRYAREANDAMQGDPRAGELAAEIERGITAAYGSAMDIGRAALRERRWKDAEPAFADALAAREADPDATRLKAEATAGRESEERYQSAIAAAAQAIDQKDWDRARDVVSEALRERPGDPRVAELEARLDHERSEGYRSAMASGRAALRERRWKAAGMAFADALAARENDPDAVRLNGEALAGLDADERYADVMETAQAALERREWDRAGDFAREALKVRPGDATARRLLETATAASAKVARTSLLAAARDASQARDWQAALSAAEKALARYPNDLEAKSILDRARYERARDPTAFVGLLEVNLPYLPQDSPASALAVSPDGRLVAVSGYFGTVRVVDVETRAEVAILEHPADRNLRVVTGKPLGALSFSTDGSQLASASNWHGARVWDARKGTLIQVLDPGAEGHERATCVAHDPKSPALAAGYADGTIRTFDGRHPAATARVQAHRGAVQSLSFSPDGRRLVTTGAADLAVRLWDARDAGAIHVWQGRSTNLDARFTPDGRKLALASAEGALQAVDIESRQVEQNIRTPHGEVNCVAVRPDGKLIATGGRDGRIAFWDAETGELIHQTEAETERHGSRVRVTWLFFTHDGARLVSTSLTGARIWGIRP